MLHLKENAKLFPKVAVKMYVPYQHKLLYFQVIIYLLMLYNVLNILLQVFAIMDNAF